MSDPVPISKRLVLINVSSSVLARVISIVGLVWVQQYLIRRLSAEEYALYPPIAAIVMFAPVLMTLLSGGILRYVTEAYAKGDNKRVTELVSSIMPLIALFIAALILLGGLAAWKIDLLLTVYPDQLADAQLMMILLVLTQAITLFLSPLSIGLHVRQRFIWVNILELGEEVLRLAVMFALLFGVSTRVLWVVVATLAARVVIALILMTLSMRALPALRVRRSAFRRETARMLTGFGAWTMLGNLVSKITMAADSIVLNKLSTAVDVTAFHIASLPDRQMMRIVTRAAAVLQTPLTAMFATNRTDGLRRAFLRGNRIMLWFALAIATPLIVFADELVLLYVGADYKVAALTAVLIYSCYPLTNASDMLYGVAMATGRVQRLMTIYAAGGLSKLGLTIVLVGPYQMGAVGAALATWIATLVTQLLFFWPLGLRMLQIPFGTFLRHTLVPGYAPALAAAATWFGMKQVVPADSWFVVAAQVALGLVVYAVVGFLCFRQEDRDDLRRIWSKIRNRLRPSG